jgi:hypothetical protein
VPAEPLGDDDADDADADAGTLPTPWAPAMIAPVAARAPLIERTLMVRRFMPSTVGPSGRRTGRALSKICPRIAAESAGQPVT